MKSIYDIPLKSATNEDNFLSKFKGKVSLVVNTTVGCGNANQLEVLQWLQDKYGGDNFQVIGIPTNDYCGPGITKGKWSKGISCGLDSQNYGRDVYNTTFEYSEMVASNPNSLVSETVGKNGLGEDHKEPHELYKEIAKQMIELGLMNIKNEIPQGGYLSPWLNHGFYNGAHMGGNYEKYLVDKDGYVVKHFECTVLNYDIEKTLKEKLLKENINVTMGEGRSMEIFNEEYALICKEIEKLISGERSPLNPIFNNILVNA